MQASNQALRPSWRELSERVHVVRLPLAERFRGLDYREALLFRGPNGWAEFSPFHDYVDEEAVNWLAAAVEFAFAARPAFDEHPHERIRVNATVPDVAAERVPAVLAGFPGCRTVKVKVAGTSSPLERDVERVAAVRALLGPDGRIRLDANGAWSVAGAERAIRRLAVFDLEYVEQPCASVAELAELRARIADLGIEIAADESVRRAEDPLAVAAAGAADRLVLKAAPLGGFSRAREVSVGAGLPVTVSSAMETSVGLALGAMLAASLPQSDAGLGTAALLAADVTHAPLSVRDGTIEVRRVSPDADLLERWAADADTERFWRARFERCFELL